MKHGNGLKKKLLAVCVCSLALVFALCGCDVGGGGGTHEHTFSDTWTTSATEHWHAATCGDTSETKDREAHKFEGNKCTVCGYTKSGGGLNPGGETIDANITFYTSVNIIEREALEAVAHAYEDLQYEMGNNITVDVKNTTIPDSYAQDLVNKVSGTITEPTIASVSPLGLYQGTNKILDLTSYLEEPNPYIEGNEAWMDALDPDAYRSVLTGATTKIPGISYSSNYTCVFYDKAAMRTVMGGDKLVAPDGTVDASKVTWQWMLDALETAKNHPASAKDGYPLALSRDKQACGQDSFNLVVTLMNMYLDQYFRDFLEEVHSEEGDYSYLPGIDANWEYDPDDVSIDAADKYTYNLNKVVDSFFNGSEYNPNSARYKEVMENLWDLLQYSNPQDSYQNCFDNFNRTTIVYENLGGSYNEFKLFYVETLGYIRTYRDAHKTGSVNVVYPDAETINKRLGWFLLPPMVSDLPGVATNLRSWGGPLENYGVLSTGSASKDKIAVDFLRFLVSPTGQQYIYSIYKKQNNAPQMMRQLVKDVQIPAEIDFTKVANEAAGDCLASPYIIFGVGNNLRDTHIGTTNTYVKDKIAETLSAYFIGTQRAWDRGNEVLGFLKDGFAEYATQNSLIYNDPSKVAEATNGLKNSPFNTSA